MKPWLKKMSLVVKYKKCSDLKRVMAFIVDFFFTLLLTLLLLASSLAIFYATPNYKEAFSIQENLKERSALFIEGKEAPLYLSENSLTIKEQARELDRLMTNFYENSYFFKDDNSLNEYNNRKLNEKYNGYNLFKEENNEIIFTFNNVPDNTYLAYLTNEYNTYALSSFRNFDEYIKTTQFISLTNLLLIIFTFLFSSIIFYFLIPFLSKNNRATLGMKIFKLGLISNSNYSLTKKEFIYRFLFFFIIEYILGFLSFFLIPLISLTYMLLSKNSLPFHDLLLNSKMIDVSGVKIFKNKYELLNTLSASK